MKHLHQLTRQQFINTIYNYKQHPDEFIYIGKTPGVVILTSSNSNFCKELEPALEIMAKRHKTHYNIYYVDTFGEQELIDALKIDQLPVFYICKVESSPVIVKENINIKKIYKLADSLLAAMQKQY